MTKDEILSLTGRKLDAAIASRLLGWDVLVVGENYYRQQLKENPQRTHLPKFSGDPAAFALLEKVVVERFGSPPTKYLEELLGVIGVPLNDLGYEQTWTESVWLVMRASLEARCKAILLAACESGE